jgi:hypothetical protein
VAAGLQRLLALEPQLVGVRPAAEALGLERGRLLHAGPPLRDPRRPPAVLLSSAVVAILHEGWTDSAEEAEAMVSSGRVQLDPAQPRGCVTPLACVVSPGMPLFEVEADGLRLHAPVSAVRGPDTRMGLRDPALFERLQVRDQRVAPAWQRALSAHGPLPLLAFAAHGLAHGDDLHSRTTAATGLLARSLRDRGEPQLADDLDATPLFFLTPWMAASALILRAAEGGDHPTLVTRAGGNGEVFGIALAGRPTHWSCVDGTAPQGMRMQGKESLDACPAIGDSAVIDMLGFGGLALAGAPEPLQAFAAHLPADHASLAQRLLTASHPTLGRPVGVDARKVVEQQCAPLVALAMLAADGAAGFVGRGLYRPPVDLFARALERTPEG